MQSESDSLRDALNVAGVTYLVYITRPANAARIDGVYNDATQVASNNPSWGAFLVRHADTLDADLATLIASADATNECTLLARGNGTARNRIDTYVLDAVDTPLEMMTAWSRDV